MVKRFIITSIVLILCAFPNSGKSFKDVGHKLEYYNESVKKIDYPPRIIYNNNFRYACTVQCYCRCRGLVRSNWICIDCGYDYYYE